jgi:hypothetical protein
MSTKKQITVWQREVDGAWRHNHIEDGWIEAAEPEAGNEYQKQCWAGATWRRTHAYLVNGEIVPATQSDSSR